MPDLTNDQLSTLAQTGALNREIEAALGRAMTAAERIIVDRARVVWRLRRRAKAERGPRSSADRKAADKSLHAQVEWRECTDPSRRSRLEKHAIAWLRHYLAQTYVRPFEEPHDAIIVGAMHASETGGRFAIAAERGVGKSSLLWGIVLLLALTGRQPFPVCVPWSATALKRAFRFWKSALCFNEVLGADYPEFTAPFQHCRGVAQRILSTTWLGGPRNGEPTGAGLAVGEGLIVLPDNRGCIGGATVNGNPRGLNHPLPDGRVLRPTLALLDDVQDRSVANSAPLVEATIEIIDGDVAGMGEAGTNLPMLMSGNCMVAGDVMSHYLESPQWSSVRVPCVTEWPAGWEDGEGPAAKLWSQWYALLSVGSGAATFYRAHKAEMTTGFTLTAPKCFKRRPGVPDAFCGVMETWHKMGAVAFHSEKQQAPLRKNFAVYELTPALILSRIAERNVGEVVPWMRLRVAATDINPSYGLTWVVVGFGADERAGVIYYGIHPMQTPEHASEAERTRAIYEALVAHGRALSAIPAMARPEYWFIDAGGAQFDVVCRFAANSATLCRLQAIPTTGRSAQHYRAAGKSLVGQPRLQSHLAADAHGRKWIAYNSHYWHEVAQRGWTGNVGAPGTCSLPHGRHEEYAQQICRQQLITKGDLGAGLRWEWHKAPGPDDYGDAMTMAYMGAAWFGIGPGGMQMQQRYVERRRPKVRYEEPG